MTAAPKLSDGESVLAIFLFQNKKNDEPILSSKTLDYKNEPNLNILRSKNTERYKKREKKAQDDELAHNKALQEKIKVKLLKQQQAKKRKEINEFMETNMLSTNYLYSEMKRIKETNRVKGVLRHMVEWLEQRGHEKEMRGVIECYRKLRIRYQQTHVDIWKHKTNNLVINYLKDPGNDGFAN